MRRHDATNGMSDSSSGSNDSPREDLNLSLTSQSSNRLSRSLSSTKISMGPEGKSVIDAAAFILGLAMFSDPDNLDLSKKIKDKALKIYEKSVCMHALLLLTSAHLIEARTKMKTSWNCKKKQKSVTKVHLTDYARSMPMSNMLRVLHTEADEFVAPTVSELAKQHAGDALDLAVEHGPKFAALATVI